MSALDDLVAASAAAGEAPPFSDQTLVDVRAGRGVVLGDGQGAAVVRGDEVELVVRQEARGRGLGSALLRQVLALETPPTLAWAHGDHPAARALADLAGWRPVRTLLQLRAPVPTTAAEVSLPAGITVEPFRVGQDESDWLALNGASFAHHPEQGGMTLDDLRARESDDWFDGGDLLLLRDAAGALAGSCWLKVEGDVGEFYAVAVRPDLQGRGRGGVLMRAGFARLAERGPTTAALYVEGDNAPALALYRRQGFTDHAVDVQYAAH